MTTRHSAALGLAVMLGSAILAGAQPCAAQDAEAEIAVPPPPTEGAAPPPTVAAPAQFAVEQLVGPLVGAAEVDLGAGRHAIAAARARAALALLPEGAPLRTRAEGFALVGEQHADASAAAPSPDAVWAPLLGQADHDLRAGQYGLGIARIDLIVSQLPEASTLRAQALQMRAAGVAAANQAPPPGAMPQPYAAPPPVPVDQRLSRRQRRAMMRAQLRGVPPPIAPPPAGPPSTHRGTAEAVELYIGAGLLGGLTGSYLAYVGSQNTASSTAYVLASVGGAVAFLAPVMAVDLTTELRAGVPPTIVGSTRIGLIHGVLALAMYETFSGGRFGGFADPQVSFSLAWGGAIAGAVVGVGVGLGLEPSVRDARFVESAALWAGGLGLYAGMLTNFEDPEVAWPITFAALDVGILASLIAVAADVHPSTRRTLFLDLGFLGGTALGLGIPLLYYTNRPDPTEARGLAIGMLIGSVTGWLLTWFLTDGVDAEDAEPRPGDATVRLSAAPVEGGMTAGLFGTF